MTFDLIDDALDRFGVPAELLPVDGIAVVALAYFFMQQNDDPQALIKAGALGITHFVLHSVIVNRLKKKCKEGSLLT